jgi:hypothetical protein
MTVSKKNTVGIHNNEMCQTKTDFPYESKQNTSNTQE